MQTVSALQQANRGKDQGLTYDHRTSDRHLILKVLFTQGRQRPELFYSFYLFMLESYKDIISEKYNHTALQSKSLGERMILFSYFRALFLLVPEKIKLFESFSNFRLLSYFCSGISEDSKGGLTGKPSYTENCKSQHMSAAGKGEWKLIPSLTPDEVTVPNGKKPGTADQCRQHTA